MCSARTCRLQDLVIDHVCKPISHNHLLYWFACLMPVCVLWSSCCAEICCVFSLAHGPMNRATPWDVAPQTPKMEGPFLARLAGQNQGPGTEATQWGFTSRSLNWYRQAVPYLDRKAVTKSLAYYIRCLYRSGRVRSGICSRARHSGASCDIGSAVSHPFSVTR